eukprot:TRINITY_DN52419_c0_g1_i1.p2 TRINITY_DN52419_c0_g1~~TRINITY_DN52419_c0_g1_i1.p2  ORF type:complete len:145 (-),score=27.86 TRINITY_DN52419_c0_g1_i1:164-598(-)
MQRGLVGSEMCIRDRYQRRVHGEGKSFRVVKYRYPLEKNCFGIKEPKDSRQYRNKKLDIAIVPIVGMDITYRRVGFGKGMYDRFFEKEIKNINKTVFVARELCYSKEIVTDDYDVKADMIIVPQTYMGFFFLVKGKIMLSLIHI